MSGTPSEKELIEAVKAVQLSIGEDNEESKDAKIVLEKVKDDHFMWKKLNIEMIQDAMNKIQESKIPPYVPPKELFHFDFASGIKPFHSISKDALKSATFQGIHHAQGGVGSSGVFIIMASNNDESLSDELKGFTGAFVLKELSISIFEELLACEIFRELGMYVPEMRPMSNEEFKDVTWRLRSAKLSIPGTCSQLHEARAQDRGGYVMSFLPNCKELGDIEDAESHASSSKASDSTESSSSQQNKKLKKKWTSIENESDLQNRNRILKEFGKMIAIDMSINNTDRFPFIWHHKGNQGNILVVSDSSAVASIDQTFSPIIENKENAESYYKRVFEGVLEAKKKDIKGSYISNVVKFIQSCTKSEIEDDGIVHIQEGILECAQKLSSNSSLIINQAWDRTHKKFKDILFSSADFKNPVVAVIKKSLKSEQAYKQFFEENCKQMAVALNHN